MRTGGLGDAVAGLAQALVADGHQVTVVIPRYRHLAAVGHPYPGLEPGSALRGLDAGGVEVFLVDDPPAFDRPGVYGPRPGEAYPDEWWRWGRFASAVRRLAEGFDVLHLHDGHAGPAALESPVPVVLTIHNPAHPVLGPLEEAAGLLGLGPAYTAPAAPLEWYGRANYLKAGVSGAVRVTTVSPRFARELVEEEGPSAGLAPVLAALPHPVVGILNGIDTASWDPATDPALPERFSPEDLEGRSQCRKALLDLTGIEDGTVLGMVGRMSEQKGIRLLQARIDRLVSEGLRLIAVGSGELEGMVDGWASRHPRAVHRLPYEEGVARLVFGGSDAYLMPSRFEPCGLGQMYAMRYGSPPVARLTGGLADTVADVDEDPDRANGFGFRPYLAEELERTIRRAIRYRQAFPDLWQELQERGMRADWSWEAAARRYGELYRQVAGG